MKSNIRGLLLWFAILSILVVQITNGTRMVRVLRAVDRDENMWLDRGGLIDADLLCKLSNLRDLSSQENIILRTTIPHYITECKMSVYYRKSGVAKNRFEGFIANPKKARALLSSGDREESTEQGNRSSESQGSDDQISPKLILIVIAVGFVLFLAYFLGKKLGWLAKDKKAALKPLNDFPGKTPPAKAVAEEAENEPEGQRSELVFFVEERVKFTLEDLLEATADLRSHSLCSSLYKVGLKNGEVYAVKRLKKSQISSEEFGKIMAGIGVVKHDNILPLVAYSSTPEDKLLIYKYQNKGNLLNLLEDCIESKSEFQWRLRLSMAVGIARGLSFIHENPNGQKMLIPHGNIKLSNILIDENEEPLVSEFGHMKFLDPNGLGLCSTNGYMAPEKGLTEKSDVYSFGVVLLELLTGKSVEKTGVDLPKWVNSMIREEWTGEVFDKRLSRSVAQWAFPLLNVALKCVSNSPENRPTFAEILERIDEVIYTEEDHDMSTMSSCSNNECRHQDCCHLHTIIPDTSDTPGSNFKLLKTCLPSNHV